MADNGPPVDEQRTLVLVNTFVIQTTAMLNQFSSVAERKLEAVHRRIQALDITMQLLEGKLKSVEGLEVATQPAAASTPAGGDAQRQAPPAQTSYDEQSSGAAAPATPAARPPPPPPPPPPGVAVGAPPPAPPPPPPAPAEEPAEDVPRVRDDPEYARFMKMVKMGVPEQAVKNKMVLEGFNPALLDTPDAPYP